MTMASTMMQSVIIQQLVITCLPRYGVGFAFGEAVFSALDERLRMCVLPMYKELENRSPSKFGRRVNKLGQACLSNSRSCCCQIRVFLTSQSGLGELKVIQTYFNLNIFKP